LRLRVLAVIIPYGTPSFFSKVTGNLHFKKPDNLAYFAAFSKNPSNMKNLFLTALLTLLVFSHHLIAQQKETTQPSPEKKNTGFRHQFFRVCEQ
jgi:hypothetical protein